MPWTIAAAAVVAAAGGASTPRRAAAASTPRTNCVNCGAPYGRFASACSYCRTLLPDGGMAGGERPALFRPPSYTSYPSESAPSIDRDVRGLMAPFVAVGVSMLPNPLPGGGMLVSSDDAPAFESGGGGDFAGAGADGSWGEP